MSVYEIYDWESNENQDNELFSTVDAAKRFLKEHYNANDYEVCQGGIYAEGRVGRTIFKFGIRERKVIS